MSYYIEVDILPYCEIPHNKIKCRFLKKNIFRSNYCTNFKEPVYNDKNEPWEKIILPCEQCIKSRKNRNTE